MIPRLFISYTNYLQFSGIVSAITVFLWIVAVSCNVTGHLDQTYDMSWLLWGVWFLIFLRLFDLRFFRVYFLIIGLLLGAGEYYLDKSMPRIVAEKMKGQAFNSRLSFENEVIGEVDSAQTSSPFVTKEKVGAQFEISYLYINHRYVLIRHSKDERFYGVSLFSILLGLLGWIGFFANLHDRFTDHRAFGWKPPLQESYEKHMYWEFTSMLDMLFLFLIMVVIYIFWAEEAVQLSQDLYEFYPAHPLFIVCFIFYAVLFLGYLIAEVWLKLSLPQLRMRTYMLCNFLSTIFAAAAIMMGFLIFEKARPDYFEKLSKEKAEQRAKISPPACRNPELTQACIDALEKIGKK